MSGLDLSVVIPVFDRKDPLRRCVSSVVSQRERISMIIVDDGSTPAFAAFADELASGLGLRARVVHQPNRGPSAARNTGLKISDSRFVLFLDSDDELAEGAYEVLEEHLLRSEDVGMVCGALRAESVGGATQTIRPALVPGVSWAKLSNTAGSFAVRTDIAYAIGGYDEHLHFGENTDFVVRLAEECHQRSLAISSTDDVLTIYHRLPDERRYDAKRLDAACHLLRRGRFDLEDPEARARLHAIATVNAARVGRYGLSVRHAARAALAEPREPRHLARLALSLCGPLAKQRWLRTPDGA